MCDSDGGVDRHDKCRLTNACIYTRVFDLGCCCCCYGGGGCGGGSPRLFATSDQIPYVIVASFICERT